ncbi:hypothetical protein GLOTRDRAFT_91909 [Gloeophyllum trabeum ATCC 11539]|uniref:Retrotransposon gag domain-containing protein n=1 Tax=Gloeophyllum trabeum (strain ATCC 11539 / FP-39264 / Madison 617) TaxID=670483 RepID=S7RYQ4_GLOTA|nr:uncharacterized protein GLOTRDRAFT_91909 [Gloeophyllum trabeum ATCC 11539]EPQ58519.1 hypothetical protein GLOTRDRAFT_91909 [Gloeophyllum trabeum ATCC 11539]
MTTRYPLRTTRTRVALARVTQKAAPPAKKVSAQSDSETHSESLDPLPDNGYTSAPATPAIERSYADAANLLELNQLGAGKKDNGGNTTSGTDEGPWETVARRHCRSPASSGKQSGQTKKKARVESVSSASETEKYLTPDTRRNAEGGISSHSLTQMGNATSQFGRNFVAGGAGEAGPSQSEGKAVDPRNWATTGLNETDLDVEQQRAALENWNTIREVQLSNKSTGPGSLDSEPRSDGVVEPNNSIHKRIRALKALTARLEAELEEEKPQVADHSPNQPPPSKKKKQESKTILPEPKSKGKASNHPPRTRGSKGLRPVNQVHPRSTIGHSPGSPDDSSDDSDSSSSSFSSRHSTPGLLVLSSSESLDSESSSGESDAPPKHGLGARHVKVKGKSPNSAKGTKKKEKQSHKTLLKPHPPAKYDGTADVCRFNKFMAEAIAYVEDGRLEKSKHARYIAYFLEGKAYDYYHNTLAGSSLDLDEFLKGLFDYCFPINFRDQLPTKLNRCYQDNRSVKEYIFELTELLSMIGTYSRQEKVVKLWKGLSKPIQAKLWEQELDPDFTPWKTVAQWAKRIEVSLATSSAVRDTARHYKSKPAGSKNQNAPSHSQPLSSDGNRNGFGKPSPQGRKPYAQSGKGASHSGGGRDRSGNCSTNKSHMSEKEKEVLRVAGKNCPKGYAVRQKQSDRSPGLDNFNANIDLSKTEQLQDLADTTEMIDTITVGQIDLFPNDRPSKVNHPRPRQNPKALIGDPHIPRGTPVKGTRPRKQRRERRAPPHKLLKDKRWLWNRDPLAVRAESLLMQGAPYPGNKGLCNHEAELCIYSSDRFHVRSLRDGTYTIVDDLVWGHAEIPGEMLADPDFNLVQWYRQALRHSLPQSILTGSNTTLSQYVEPMGPAIANHVSAILESDAPYYGDNNQRRHSSSRFTCHLDDDEVIIYDREWMYITQLPGQHALNPKFNLPHWYDLHLRAALNDLRRRVMEGGNQEWCLPELFESDTRKHEFTCILNDYKDSFTHLTSPNRVKCSDEEDVFCITKLNRVQVKPNAYPNIQRNAAVTRDFKRLIPKPLVVVVNIKWSSSQGPIGLGFESRRSIWRNPYRCSSLFRARAPKSTEIVQAHWDHHRRPLDYSQDADPIFLVTDASHGGLAGVISQGRDFKSAHVAVFHSAKMNTSQLNYAVHE